jgi:tetratricopeptide (TPR) repeat protein
MRSNAQTLAWLNHEDGSHLTQQSQLTVWQINDPTVPDEQKETIIENLVACTRDVPDPLEYAEVLSICGKAQADRQNLVQSADYFQKAARIYLQCGDAFREVLALWCLSLVQRSHLEGRLAHAHATEAKTILESRRRLRERERLEAVHSWYTSRLSEMNEILAETPAEIFSWLSRFEESHLKTATRQLAETAWGNIHSKNFARVYQVVTQLLELSQRSDDPGESAEIIALSGLIYYEIGNSKEACRMIRQAGARYAPGGHQQILCRWMLAMVQWSNPQEMTQAISTSNQVIDYIDGLRTEYDRKNRVMERDWYEKLGQTMRNILQRRIAEINL